MTSTGLITSFVDLSRRPLRVPGASGRRRLVLPALARSRVMRCRALLAGACGLLVVGVSQPWLGTDLGRSTGSLDLQVRGMVLPTVSALRYGHLVLLALLMAAASGLSRPNRALLAVAAALSTAAAGLFAVLGSFIDTRLYLQLLGDQADAQTVLGGLPYKVPRPHIDNLLLVPLDERAGLLVSALRVGWLATLLGGALLVVCWRLAPARPEGMPRAGRHSLALRRASVVVGWSLLVLVLGGGLVRAALARVQVHHAASAAAQADAALAVARLRDAMSTDPSLRYDKQVQLAYGEALLLTGRTGAPEALLAQSRRDLMAGGSRRAAADLQQALALRPGDLVLQDEAARRAVASAVAERAPEVALAAVVGGAPSDEPLLWTAAKLSFQQQDYDAAISSFRHLVASTRSADVRSAAWTYVAVAQQRTGSADAARRTLARALAEDHGHDNVVARSMAAGLYDAVTL